LVLVIIFIASVVFVVDNLDELVPKYRFTEITVNNLEERIKNHDSFVVMLYQDACPGCEKNFELLSEWQENHNIEVVVLNVNEETRRGYLVQTMNLEVTPTTFVYDNGVLIKRVEGPLDDIDFGEDK